MTNKEWERRLAEEKKARAEAIALLCQALQKAGVPLISLEIFERGASAWSKLRSRGVSAGRTSAWTPRIPRSGIFCGRSPSSGNH